MSVVHLNSLTERFQWLNIRFDYLGLRLARWNLPDKCDSKDLCLVFMTSGVINLLSTVHFR